MDAISVNCYVAKHTRKHELSKHRQTPRYTQTGRMHGESNEHKQTITHAYTNKQNLKSWLAPKYIGEKASHTRHNACRIHGESNTHKYTVTHTQEGLP